MSGSIHPETKIGAVHLTVRQLDRSISFYGRSLGFQLHRRDGNTAYLGAGKEDLLVLSERPGATRAVNTAGLYHFAVLVPSRLELARSLTLLGMTKTAVQGFADHFVSEAVYLEDPDGNGIEIYRDRPRQEWTFLGGRPQIGTAPLDVDAVLAELEGKQGSWSGLDPETQIGHVHLHVSDLQAAEAFYTYGLGFDLIMRYGPSAGFVSAGGYHHHIGYNTWAGVGVSPQPPDAVGLRWFVIQLPSTSALDDVLRRLQGFNVTYDKRPEGILVRDPSGNGIMLIEKNLEDA